MAPRILQEVDARLAGFEMAAPQLRLQPEARELLVELGHLAAGVDDALHAGPGGMRPGVDVQPQRVARLAG